MVAVTARLLVSLSGITASTLDRADDLCTELAARGVPLSLLLAPRLAGAHHPDAVRTWVRTRVSAGDALLQHGFDPATAARRRRAEFAALPAHEANLRLIAAATTMERLGLTPDGFVPPRWLASPGTLTALRRHGVPLCADAIGVRDLRAGTVHRGRVQGFGFGERTEPWWCFALVMTTARQARRGATIRLAADTADLTRPGPHRALLDAIDIALHHDARPVTYPALLPRPRAHAA
ncbi:DUF2334 domain-containing protein [Actinophytocola gossypii]|uniref:DUF2334 domain-containing protein n=1 Tax=Actinophytocola gossypii TaxID=2812003 RepID=A0ABT2JE37_9PSEU|nr:DUF2334 domain-containing protein [Actinophytocola gossypii]MCT2585986.1 DUF2334 domain-containing protein [Actinophytocola gossypii]